MAQLIVPINAYANGNALSTGDWTNPITRAGTTLTVAGTSPNKTLQIFGNVAGTKIFNYVPVNSVTDIEVLVKFRLSSDFGKQGVVMLRYDGNSEATTAGYAASGSFISSAGQLAIDEGQVGYLFWAPWNYLPNIDYWVRFRVNGNNQYAKVWTNGTPEPAGWTTAGTNGTKPTGTYNGLHTYSINNAAAATVTYYFVSFGTNGDSAPGIQATMADVSQAQSLDAVTLVQSHTLGVNDISQAHALDDVNVIHNIFITVDDLSQAQTLESPEVMPEGIVFPEDLQHAQTLDAAVLSQKHTLSIDDMLQAQLLEAPEPVEGLVLVVDDAAQSQDLGATNIIQAHLLAISDVLNAQTLSEPSLSQRHLLAPENMLQIQLLELPGLALQELFQQHTLDSVEIQIIMRPSARAGGVVQKSKNPPSTSVVRSRMHSDVQVARVGAKKVRSYEIEDPNSPLVDDPVAIVDDPFALAGQLVNITGIAAPNAETGARIKVNANQTKPKGAAWQISPGVSQVSKTSIRQPRSLQITTQPGTTRSMPKSMQSPKKSARMAR